MANKYVTTQQYEPLRTPSDWSREERALLQQLTDRFDDLYGRFNRLRFEDLGKVLQGTIAEKVDKETFQTSMTQTAEAITLKADKTTMDTISGQVSTLSSQIQQTAESISLRVTREEMETAIGVRVALVSSHGMVLSELVQNTTISAKVYRGSTDITGDIDSSKFIWRRISKDDMADTIWGENHVGMKSITVTTQDVVQQATFELQLME